MTVSTTRKPLPQRAEALFAATGSGTVSLLLGASTCALRDTIAALGGQAVTAGDPAACVSPSRHVVIGSGLPFAAASFDSVFALYLSAADLGAPSSSGSALELVEECARVLKPGGRLVVSLPNPYMLAGLAGAATLYRGPFASLLPLTLKAKLNLHRTDPGLLPYSRRRLSRLLRAAGFSRVVGFRIWPRLGTWASLVHESEAGLKKRLQRARSERNPLARALGIVGIAPGRFVIAQAPVQPISFGPRAAVPVLESILRPSPWDFSTVSATTLRAKGQTVVLATVGDTFYKIAVTPGAAERQRAETAAHEQLRDSTAGRFMVDLRRDGQIGSLGFAVYAAAEPLQYANEAEEAAAQAEAFTLLGSGAELRPLNATATWSRIFSELSRSRLDRLGGGDLCAYMELSAAGKLVLAGNVHGDLHQQNIMRRQGRTVLIDWDRFESMSPLIIDRCSGVYRLLTRRLRPLMGERRHLAALKLIAHRDEHVPLLSYIDAAAGELTWREVVLTFVLSATSWRLIGARGNDADTQRDARQQLAFCRELLTRA